MKMPRDLSGTRLMGGITKLAFGPIGAKLYLA